MVPLYIMCSLVIPSSPGTLFFLTYLTINLSSVGNNRENSPVCAEVEVHTSLFMVVGVGDRSYRGLKKFVAILLIPQRLYSF